MNQSVSSRLSDLVDLHKMGALTDVEFANEKAALLNAHSPTTSHNSTATMCERHPRTLASIKCKKCEEALCESCKELCYNMYNEPLCIDCADLRAKKEYNESMAKIIAAIVTIVLGIVGFVYGFLLNDLLWEMGLAMAFGMAGGASMTFGIGIVKYSGVKKAAGIAGVFVGLVGKLGAGGGLMGNIISGDRMITFVIKLIGAVVSFLVLLFGILITSLIYVFFGLPGAIKTLKKSGEIKVCIQKLKEWFAKHMKL